KARNFDYYEPITVRDSSLSASTQAIIAAEVGHLDLAYDYLGEAALMDLLDLEHNTRDGVHIASLAGSWLALICGFGGMRLEDGELSFTPRLSQGLARISFKLRIKSGLLHVEVTPATASYTLIEGDSLTFTHHGAELTVTTSSPQHRRIPAATPRPAPRQPPGREPIRRRPLMST